MREHRRIIPIPVILACWFMQTERDARVVVPRTWNDAQIASLEVPLANPIGSPKHVSADYYYRIPVAPIFKSYPVYAPGRESQAIWTG